MTRETHPEFIERAAKANSLPAQTEKALAPESDEDRAMYNQDKCVEVSELKTQHDSAEESPDVKIDAVMEDSE